MYQPPISSYFNARKRLASDYLCAPTSKKLLLAPGGDAIKAKEAINVDKVQKPIEAVANGEKAEKVLPPNPKRQIVVARKKRLVAKEKSCGAGSVVPGAKVPVMSSANSQENVEEKKASMDLSIKEIQEKVKKSKKLTDLKEQLLKLQEMEKKRQMLLRQNTTPTKVEAPKEEGQSLKKFNKLDLEVLSPTKVFKSPLKMKIPTPGEAAHKPDTTLMSPRKDAAPRSARKVLFSPQKGDEGQSEASSSTPAYEKYASLVESGRPGLQLPFKYRQLVEIFKSCDAVCAMFHNRKETITFKKLKPAVQQLCRKTFTPAHLAQIETIFPGAYTFHQSKTRNYGSTSKQDYFQLVIEPKPDHLSPQILIERQKTFTSAIEMRVRRQHYTFLRSLTPPMVIPMQKITRWHPEFDLEACPAIPEANLPRPPNEEKFSSARDVLSAAKNLFNCSTSMERTTELLEARQALPEPQKKAETAVSDLLKRVPAKLVEKIRAKQAAKALEAMTRRPSQDEEAVAYSRLPELAKHIRNIFMTEKKSCLTLEIVLGKIANSYRANLPAHVIESLIGVLSREVKEWLSIEEIRKVKYVKLARGIDFWQLSRKLERLATEKSV
ncbi:DNA replication factor Cdt1 [Lutzomyia longipalpis]|uniref:DNA replication factor Cdt1 n=1 Tax=Lutzomyia longipalpis TaxID=7200 RepID=UPI00248427BE|nr:DNA replication factor Cdt1 [Lutzomyia longipalpis]